MNWKISKIEIASFKAFKKIHLDFSDSSLLTLDGPNGFGKTSIFDAIELLLTGSIRRIHQLFSTLMSGIKTNYEDNLLWNNRLGKSDLTIKIEFTNGSSTLVLARHASAEKFEQKSNNRADQFSHIALYQLPEFSSNDYSESNFREESLIEEIFGKNFRENFSYLNYLEQGQNQFLHKRVDKRKEALNNLFNISDAKTEIDHCKAIAARLNKVIKNPDLGKELSELEANSAALQEMILGKSTSVEYKSVSTVDLIPGWDKKDPFPIYSVEMHEEYRKKIQQLKSLTLLKNSVKIRIKNDEIDDYIESNKSLLLSIARFGSDIDKLAILDNTKSELDELNRFELIIKRSASSIRTDEAKSLPGWAAGRLDWFIKKIDARNELQRNSTANAKIAAELNNLKRDLIIEHSKICHEDPCCPLCGADWKSHTAMLHKIELRSNYINDALSSDEQSMVNLIRVMNEELAVVEKKIKERIQVLSNQYNSTLHQSLLHDKPRLSVITALANSLHDSGLNVSYMFTENQEEVDARFQVLKGSISNQKIDEKETLPQDWRQTISSVFKELEDFYIADLELLKNKELYIETKADEAKNKSLKQCLDKIELIQRKIKAASLARSKVLQLKQTIERVERSYSEQTIAEIELVFHIYSGRLIQNYQRGLGLFIESKDGKELKFLTAERSEHDAILSMSSGQVSALSLGFFLSLNRVYSKVPLMLIDDPSQSLDEVNIASLTDLLRCEFSSRQLIVSSHEDDISAYMRYRFTKAGLISRSLNMQRLAKEALV